MNDRIALLLDGGFVTRKLTQRLDRFPGVSDVNELVSGIMSHERLRRSPVFRIYYYDCPPLERSDMNPISREVITLGTSLSMKANGALLNSLELEPDFAVRRGTLSPQGWKLGSKALKDLKRTKRSLTPRDMVPDIKQKGVDLRIGLDIATLALKKPASTIVLVTGDSDLVPAMKHARTEGLRVYLDCMGHGVHRELKAHADLVL